MPEGSSSDAPVVSPGPNVCQYVLVRLTTLLLNVAS